MRTIEDKKKIKFQSEDVNGGFQLSLTTGQMPQMVMTSHIDGGYDEEAYINLSGLELIAIRDMINAVIKINNWE